MSKLYRDYQVCRGSIKDYASAYFKYLEVISSQMSTEEIELFITTLLQARARCSTIYFIGNGGSASTAGHFANDIGIGTKAVKNPFRVVSLCDNQAILTAIANDYGFENIFSKQLEIMLNKSDVVVAISASGNSENLLRAMKVASEKQAITVGLTSFDGGKLRKMVDVSVHVPTEKGDYGPAEDWHLIIDHLVGSYLSFCIEDER